MAKNIKLNKKQTKIAIISIIVLILIVAIALTTIYFASPSTWDMLVSLVVGSDASGDNSGAGSGANLDDGKGKEATNGILPDGKLAYKEGDLQVHFIDVGQGDSILILFPDGDNMLIDCGSADRSNVCKESTLAYLDTYLDTTINHLMLTHTDLDHVSYLDEVVDLYQVDNIYMPNILASNDDVADASVPASFTDMFDDEDTIETVAYASFFVGAYNEPDCNIVLNEDSDESTNTIKIETTEYTLTFYCPTASYYDTTDLSSAEEKNAVSPIGILEYDGFRVMFTGDSNEINEEDFVERMHGSDVNCDVLKVGHHGSSSSSISSFLDMVDCEYAVISCNEDGNSHEHPRQDALDRMTDRDMDILRTDNNGNIVLVINDTMEFLTEKPVDQAVNQIGADTDND